MRLVIARRRHAIMVAVERNEYVTMSSWISCRHPGTDRRQQPTAAPRATGSGVNLRLFIGLLSAIANNVRTDVGALRPR